MKGNDIMSKVCGPYSVDPSSPSIENLINTPFSTHSYPN